MRCDVMWCDEKERSVWVWGVYAKAKECVPIDEHLLAPSRVTRALVMKTKGRRKTSRSIVQKRQR